MFPAGSLVKPVYIVVSVSDHKYHPAPTGLSAFPDATKANRKTAVKGGGNLRKRWKTPKGTIFEWDSQHGTVEMYDKRGRHLGEYDPITGEQTKLADNTRKVEP